MSIRERAYFQQELEMCQYRVRLYQGNSRAYESGNPMTVEVAEIHLNRTLDFISNNSNLYA